jgi:hypothetical protein
MRNPKDFFAKWQGSEDEQFAAYVRVLSEIGEEFGLDYETCYEFCHRVFGENSNYKTGMCFIKQVMDYCRFLDGLPGQFDRPTVELSDMAEWLGFATGGQTQSDNLDDYRNTLDTISLQLRGVLADMNGELLCRK